MLDPEAFLRQFADQFLDGGGFVQFHQLAATAVAVLFVGRGGQGEDLLSRFEFEKVEVLLVEFVDTRFVVEVFDPFVVPLAHFDEEGGKFFAARAARGEEAFEVAAVPADGFAEFGHALQQFQDVLQLRGGKFLAVGEVFQAHVFGAEVYENLVELHVVIDVLLAFLALDLVERRLGDEDFPGFHQVGHLAVEEGQEQGADVRAVHVGVRHDDDAPVTELGDVERALLFARADAGADGRYHRLDFRVLQDAVQPRFLDVDELAADGEDGLVTAVAALLGGAAGGVALDDVKLGQVRVALGAIGQLAGEAAAGQRALADGLAGAARGFAGAGGEQAFVDDLLRDGRVLVEECHEPFVDDGVDDAVDLRVDELHFGLGLEARVREFHAQDADEAFAHVVAGDGRVFFLQQIVGLRVLVDRFRQRAAEPGEVRAAIGIRDGVGEAENLVVVGVGVLEDDVDEDFLLLPRQDDGLGMDELLVLAELADEFLDAVAVQEALLAHGFGAFVDEDDLQARVEKRQFPHAAGEAVELELRGDGEDGRVRQEGDERAGVFLILDLADDVELLGRLPALEGHVVEFAVAADLDLEPVREGVDALGTDAVEAAAVFVGALAELAAGVEIRQDKLDGGHLPFRMHVHGDAAPVVPHGDGAVDMDGHVDLGAEPGEVFVDGVVQHLEYAVVEPAFVRVADIHSGPFPDRFQPLQFVDF